ncbi:dynein axonemal assembly factor 1 isoform X9 [Calliphora vicina]|uniref:dynein axonemal assembly factor 1 isoform X9 n=1 Tax=Calliphora vicina TaxID=7373 RepID=UPI00325B653E
MTRLTEEMVIARSKQSDLSSIKKLNCWGSDLSDVSIIKRMRGVEVLALSVNKISTLQPFEDCLKLQELYLRKNNIQDINEIAYLQNLPNLKYLWLEENPCCDRAGANYRAIVLRALPNLKKLDNVEVTQEEVDEASRGGSGGGVVAVEDDPYDDAYEQQQQQQQQQHQQQQYEQQQYQQQQQRQQQQQPQQQPPQPQQQQYQSSQYQQRRSSSPQKEEYYQSDRPAYPAHYRHSQTDLTEWDEHHTQQQHHSNHNPYGSTAALHHMGQRRSAGPERTEPVDRYAYRNGRENGEWEDERPRPRRPDGRYADSASTVSTAVLNHYTGYHRRPINRSSNLLSATLCLVKELDYPSLEVVEHAVRCRIDELSAE